MIKDYIKTTTDTRNSCKLGNIFWKFYIIYNQTKHRSLVQDQIVIFGLFLNSYLLSTDLPYNPIHCCPQELLSLFWVDSFGTVVPVFLELSLFQVASFVFCLWNLKRLVPTLKLRLCEKIFSGHDVSFRSLLCLSYHDVPNLAFS